MGPKLVAATSLLDHFFLFLLALALAHTIFFFLLPILPHFLPHFISVHLENNLQELSHFLSISFLIKLYSILCVELDCFSLLTFSPFNFFNHFPHLLSFSHTPYLISCPLLIPSHFFTYHSLDLFSLLSIFFCF